MRTKTRKRKLFWQIFSSYLIISLSMLVLVTFYVTATLRSHSLAEARESLSNNTALAGEYIAHALGTGQVADINELCRRFSRVTKLRFTAIAQDGKVLGDSHYQIDAMESHADRPEIRDALAGHTGYATRYSETLKKKMLYVAGAVKLANGDKLVMRASRPLNEIEQAVLTLQFSIVLAWLVSSSVAAFAFLIISQRISRPFESLRSKALAMVQEGHSQDVDFTESHLDEAGGLSEAIQQMVHSLNERTSTISQQREELEAILASMSEALMAIDRNGRVLKINNRMAEVFHLDPLTCRGQKVGELIRNKDFNEFIKLAMESHEVLQKDLVFYAPQPLHLNANSTRMRDAHGSVIGAVIVVNDMTRLKRLEDLRKDFVANVSHELRTPITSIKGFVETLESGALEDPEAARRFLAIISRQTNRLSNIIEDLLSLSKIEQQEGRWQLELEPLSLRKTLKGAVRHCEEQAAEKQIRLELNCEADLMPKLHSSLFEQAVVNLVDNAVKYSDKNKLILISAEREGDQIHIDFLDQGFGIPRMHLPRLFERFYRVDKARSRDVGGTGLGLSIVKHIVVAHGGSIQVQSEVGQGSTFTITLPAT